MERHSNLIDKTINFLSWNRGTDLYAQLYMKLFTPGHSNIKEHNYGKNIAVKLQQPERPLMEELSHVL